MTGQFSLSLYFTFSSDLMIIQQLAVSQLNDSFTRASNVILYFFGFCPFGLT